jgi:prolyl 4-hydroxylase
MSTSTTTDAQPAAQAQAQTLVQPPAQPITPELRQWIVEQAEAGCRPADVIAAMQASGWQEDVAIEAMERTLQDHLAKIQGEQQLAAAPAQAAPAVAVATVEELPPATPVPEPVLDGSPTVLMLGQHAVRVLMTLRNPRVVVFGNLLSDDECAGLMALAEGRLARSEIVDNQTGGSEVNVARTSEGMFFQRAEAPLIDRIEQRIAQLLNWPLDHGEGMQVLRYRPGAEYKPHHDYFDPAQPGSTKILERGGQRVGTLVMYLNTPEGGGATTFPDVNLEVAPVRGNAVFFSYDRAHPSTRTLHGGAPVVAGEKWVATKWLRQGVFV